jgi:hypothetical protein
MHFLFVSLALVGSLKIIGASKVHDLTLLNSYPMIMSHDSASGEIDPDRDHVVMDWTRTQSDGLVKQLDCGARSFDYRPYLNDDKIIAHHGGVKIKKTMESSLLEILSWSNKNPDDLIVLYLSHYDGDKGVETAVSNLLKKLNIYFIEDCSILKTLTYQQAVKNAIKLPSQSKVLAIKDCTTENYDDKINCYSRGVVCYEDDKSTKAWNAFDNYVQLTTSTNPVGRNNSSSESSYLWMAQAHWQSSAESITIGE